MKQCKYCGSSRVVYNQDKCVTCFVLKELIGQNVTRAQSVLDRDRLEGALRVDRHRYVSILQDLETNDD